MNKINKQGQRHCLLYSLHLSTFSKPFAYITHNTSETISEITGGSLLDFMQHPLEPHKHSHTTFHICSTVVAYLKGYSSVSLIHGLNHCETVLDSLSEIKLADR